MTEHSKTGLRLLLNGEPYKDEARCDPTPAKGFSMEEAGADWCSGSSIMFCSAEVGAWAIPECV